MQYSYHVFLFIGRMQCVGHTGFNHAVCSFTSARVARRVTRSTLLAAHNDQTTLNLSCKSSSTVGSPTHVHPDLLRTLHWHSRRVHDIEPSDDTLAPMRPKLKTTPDASARMKRIRQSGTAPELRVREFLSGRGVQYRACVASLPGKPDIANKTRRWAVFVHGCYWHGHEGCRLATVPKTNREFWMEKVKQNQARDRKKEEALRAMGFLVETIWQCETLDQEKLESRLCRILAMKTQ